MFLKNKYFFVKLKGGIGNQIFILFFAMIISRHKSHKLIIDMNSGFFYDKYSRRPEIQKIFKNLNNFFLFHNYKLLSKFFWKSLFVFNKFIYKNKFYYNDDKIDNTYLSYNKFKKKYIFFDGYWQSLDFNRFNNFLKKKFILSINSIEF